MHLIHNVVTGSCWGDPKEPPILNSNTGRKRLDILGAYDINTHQLIHLTGEENCDAKRAIEFFESILKSGTYEEKLIVDLDNARYFKAEIVSKWLKEHPKLEARFLPAYAPNLNLIERFWRFAKNRLVRNTYYKQYKTFRASVFQLLSNIDKYINELKTLMADNFEIVTQKPCR